MEPRPGPIRRLDATGIPLLLARLGVGGIFAYLAVMKLRDPFEFLKAIHTYHIFDWMPYWAFNMVAIGLPCVELTCAVLLLLGIGVRGAALLVNAMLLFFTPMLALRALELLHSGQFAVFCAVKFDCGCGTGVVFICPKLVENVALQIGALWALFSASRRFCLSTVLTRRPPQPAAVQAGARS